MVRDDHRHFFRRAGAAINAPLNTELYMAGCYPVSIAGDGYEHSLPVCSPRRAGAAGTGSHQPAVCRRVLPGRPCPCALKRFAAQVPPRHAIWPRGGTFHPPARLQQIIGIALAAPDVRSARNNKRTAQDVSLQRTFSTATRDCSPGRRACSLRVLVDPHLDRRRDVPGGHCKCCIGVRSVDEPIPRRAGSSCHGARR